MSCGDRRTTVFIPNSAYTQASLLPKLSIETEVSVLAYSQCHYSAVLSTSVSLFTTAAMLTSFHLHSSPLTSLLNATTPLFARCCFDSVLSCPLRQL